MKTYDISLSPSTFSLLFKPRKVASIQRRRRRQKRRRRRRKRKWELEEEEDEIKKMKDLFIENLDPKTFQLDNFH